MTDVIQFHNLSHTFISLIGAVLLAAIYYNIKSRYQSVLEDGDSIRRVDRGLLYLSLALFTWTISGLWAFMAHRYEFAGGFTDQIGINFLSIINNMFFMLALFYFSYAPAFIYNNEKNVWRIIFIIAAVTITTLIVSYFAGNGVYGGLKLIAIPDVLLSGFLCYLFLISLYKTFMHRGLKLVAMISVLVVLLVFFSQIPDVFLSLDNEFVNNLIKIIAKISLIALFLVLATTWVIQLAHTPKAQEIQIRFIDWCLIELTIPSKEILNTRIDFGSKTTQYKNLLKLGIRRKYGEPEDQSILVGSAGEIKSQTYLTRIMDNINDILGLKIDQQLERKDLLTFIGEGKYRLRMLPDHIWIEPALLKEFSEQADHQQYASLCNSL